MPYDVLSKDLLDDGTDSLPPRQKRRIQAQSRAPPRPFFLKPIFIHILLIIILLGFIAIFIQKTYDIGGPSQEVNGEVTLAGDLQNFSRDYNGNLSIYSSQFTLETSTGTFDDTSKDINIENFNGKIYLTNTTMVLEGTGKKITYGKNTIKLTTEPFKLISPKKTSIDFEFTTLDLTFETGNLKLDKTFNYDFENSTLSFTNFNVTMTYDTTFTFFGVAQSFKINSPNDKLQIAFKDD